MTEEAKPDSGKGEGGKGKRKSHLTLWILISIVAAIVLAPHFATKVFGDAVGAAVVEWLIPEQGSGTNE
jgi:hypothetical protein